MLLTLKHLTLAYHPSLPESDFQTWRNTVLNSNMQLCVCLNLYAIKNIFWLNSLNLVSYKLIDSPQWINPGLTGDIASLWNHNVWKPVPTTAICLYYLNHFPGSWGSGCPRQPLHLLSCYPWCWIFTVQEGKSKLLSRVWLFVTPWTIQSMEFSRPNRNIKPNGYSLSIQAKYFRVSIMFFLSSFKGQCTQ